MHCLVALAGGRVLTRIPFDSPTSAGRLGDALSLILTGQDTFALDHAHEVFLDLQREVLEHDFRRRLEWNQWDVPESRWDDLDWLAVLQHLATAEVWLFTPTGTDSAQWSVSPVILVAPHGKWSEYLE